MTLLEAANAAVIAMKDVSMKLLGSMPMHEAIAFDNHIKTIERAIEEHVK